MKLPFALYFAIGLSTAAVLKPLSLTRKPRIVAGEEAAVGMFPYAAAVHVSTDTGRFFCGGTLLGDQWIVTAAQCVVNAVSFTIQLGSNSLNNDDPNRLTLATSTYIIHPDFDPISLDNDVGVIKLRMPVELTDYIKPVLSVPVDDIPADWRCLALGWGQTSDSNPDLSENLHWVALTSITNEECKLTYGNQVTDNMMCAAGNYHEGTCIGDTGSPLVYLIRYGNALLVGIASFVSANGCESPHPSGYTRVDRSADWITNVTGVPHA